MRALADTHIFLWFVNDDPQLSRTAKAFLSDNRNVVFVSVVSAWEFAIKVGIGKLQLTEPVAVFFDEEITKNGFRLLPVELRHVAPVETLPLHHRDPFDRLLISQSIVERMPIISADAVFDAYEGVTRVW